MDDTDTRIKGKEGHEAFVEAMGSIISAATMLEAIVSNFQFFDGSPEHQEIRDAIEKNAARVLDLHIVRPSAKADTINRNALFYLGFSAPPPADGLIRPL